MWQAVLRLAGRRPRPWMAYTGPTILLTAVLVWALLLWAGWLLVLSSDPRAVLDSGSGEPADLAARAYFTAYVVVTLGVGDYVPGGPGWQLLTGLISLIGLFVVTLSITYLISVVSAAVDRRRLSHAVEVRGCTGIDVVLLHWRGGQVDDAFSSWAAQLTSDVLGTTEKHLAYPVLHLFHGGAQVSAPRGLAVLDDAVLLMAEGLVPTARPSPAVLEPLVRAMTHYAGTVEAPAGVRADAPLPDLARLRRAGVPVVADDAFALAAVDHRERRRALHALVTSDAHQWPVSTSARVEP